MTSQEFKKVARVIKAILKEIESQAIAEGIDITSTEYEKLVARARLGILKKSGFTLEEYQQSKEETLRLQKEERQRSKNQIAKELLELNREKVDEQTVRKIAEEYIKEPVINNFTTNEIIKETIIEKPVIVEKRETIIEREEYDDSAIKTALESITERLESTPEAESLDLDDVKNIFAEMFEHNINTIEMPDFRKLAMGLQQQIDHALSGVQEVRTISGGSIKPSDSTVITTADVSLPAGTKGKTYIIKNISDVDIVVTAPVTIDGENSQIINTYDAMRVQFTGTEYIII